MSKLFRKEDLEKELLKYSKGKLRIKKDKELLLYIQGTILNLIPELNHFLVENGLDSDDDTVPYMAIAAFGAVLKQVGEDNLEETGNDNLKKLKALGEDYEEYNDSIDSNPGIKLCQ